MIKTKNNIEKEVLNHISPSSKERKELEKIIIELIELIKQEIKKKNLLVSIKLVGSTAKGTYLKNNLDIDIFLLFYPNVTKENMSKSTLSIGRLILENTEECYAEHPYIRGYFKNNKIEIVPCYKIKKASQILSAVDRTPFHTEYVKNNLNRFQKDEVLLFKQFLIGIGCYGAESKVEGFSGYLCEILIIKYKSFQNLISNAKDWKFGKKLTLSKKNIPFFNSPLTFTDPVDNDRNVASALSNKKFDLFVKACQEYIKNPKITFFFPNKIKPWSINKIKSEISKQKCLYIGVILSKPDIIDEDLYPQIRKAVRSISKTCKKYGFTIFDGTFHIDKENNKVIIIIKTKKDLISKKITHIGPPLKLKNNVQNFIKKWECNPRVIMKPYEKNGRFYVEIEREYRNITDFLKDRVKNISMGKNLDEIIKDNYKIIKLNDLLDDDLRLFWTKYLNMKMTWDQ